MRLEGIPKEVQKAQIEENHGALSAMGHVGAEHAALNRIIAKVRKAEAIAERIQELAKVETVSPDGEVLPPDDPNSAEGIIYH